MDQYLTLDCLARGETAVITAIDRGGVDPATADRVHEMGFDEGVEVELLHRAPLGDPIMLRVGTMSVALRRRLAAMITVASATARHAGFREAAE